MNMTEVNEITKRFANIIKIDNDIDITYDATPVMGKEYVSNHIVATLEGDDNIVFYKRTNKEIEKESFATLGTDSDFDDVCVENLKGLFADENKKELEDIAKQMETHITETLDNVKMLINLQLDEIKEAFKK